MCYPQLPSAVFPLHQVQMSGSCSIIVYLQNATSEVSRGVEMSSSLSKRCFVTVGATASFTSLIRAVLEPAFLETLHAQKYTELRIQYGKDGKKIFEDYIWVLPDDLKQKVQIEITGFDFRKDGLREEMLTARKGGGQQGAEGCVISHAGKEIAQI